MRFTSTMPTAQQDAPYKVHVLGDDAYAETQTSDEISTGDMLVIPGLVVGFMMEAWPIAVKWAGDSDTPPAGFHTLAADVDLSALGKKDKVEFDTWIHPRTYTVVVGGKQVGEPYDSKLDAEDAARAARGTVRHIDGEKYQVHEVYPAHPGYDMRLVHAAALARTL